MQNPLQKKKLEFLRNTRSVLGEELVTVRKVTFRDSTECYVDPHGRVMWLQEPGKAQEELRDAYFEGWHNGYNTTSVCGPEPDWDDSETKSGSTY